MSPSIVNLQRYAIALGAVSLVQLGILLQVDSSPTNESTLSVMFSCTLYRVSREVSRLVRRGLVERSKVGRFTLVSTTSEGKNLIRFCNEP